MGPTPHEWNKHEHGPSLYIGTLQTPKLHLTKRTTKWNGNELGNAMNQNVKTILNIRKLDVFGIIDLASGGGPAQIGGKSILPFWLQIPPPRPEAAVSHPDCSGAYNRVSHLMGIIVTQKKKSAEFQIW